MGRLGAALWRLFSVGALPDCERCGERMTAIRERRMVIMPPVFEITCRCEVCGALTEVRQVVETFN